MTGRCRHLLLAGVFLLIAGMRALPASAASIPPETLAIVRRIVIQHGGRHKPFDSFARETLRAITGSPSWEHQDPVATVLSIVAEPDAWQDAPLVDVPFKPLREALGMTPATPRISYNDLVSTRKLMRMLPAIVEKQERDEKLTMLENETMDAFNRFVSLNRLFEHDLELVPAPAVWRSIRQSQAYPAWSGFIDAIRQGEPAGMRASAERLARTLRETNPAVYPATWRIELELFYNRAGVFQWAVILYLIAAIGLGW